MATNFLKRKNRATLDFETKTKIYNQYHLLRPTIESMARDWNICKSTVKRIIEDKKSYKKPRLMTIAKLRSAVWEMEKLLGLWIEDRFQRKVRMTAKQIQTQATNLYNNMKKLNPSTYLDFKANEYWFEQFRLRVGKSQFKLSSEPVTETMIKCKGFPDELKALIKKEGYLPQQVFNVDRVLLFWKTMPDSTFLSKKALEIPNDRVTLLLGCNARDGYKLKPLLIYNTEYPCGLENIPNDLPVYYRSSTSSWLTMQIFEEWFVNDFIPETKEYCQRNGIPFKILLLLDASPRNTGRLIGLHPNVKVVYFPINTSLRLQPVDQGIKSIFKAFYFSNSLSMLKKSTQGDTDSMVQDFCKAYTIQMGITNINKAWEAIPNHFLTNAWKYLCPQFVETNTVAQEFTLYHRIKRQIHSTASKLGIHLRMKDVDNWIQWTGSDLTTNELIALSRLIDVNESNSQIDLTENENNNNSPGDIIQCTSKQLNDQKDLTNNVNNNSNTTDEVDDGRNLLTEDSPKHITPTDQVDDGRNLLTEYLPKHITLTDQVDDGRNLLTEYLPKHITVSEDEESEDQIIVYVTITDPVLVEPTALKVIPRESVVEEIMEISDSESVIIISPTTTEDVVNSANDVEESQEICDELSQSLQQKNKEQNKVDEELPGISGITEKIELAFDHITYAMETFESIDPNKARFKAVDSAVNDMLSCYKKMIQEKSQTQPIVIEYG